MPAPLATVAVLLHLVALPPGVGGEYFTEEALESLRCIRAWEELCDWGGYPGWAVRISATEVVARPYDRSNTSVRFKVTKQTPDALELVATRAGRRGTATISISGRRLTWSGVDVRAFLRNDTAEQVTVALVSRQRLSTLWKEALRRFAPPGGCMRLMWWPREEEGPCINTGTGLPETIEVE